MLVGRHHCCQPGTKDAIRTAKCTSLQRLKCSLQRPCGFLQSLEDFLDDDWRFIFRLSLVACLDWAEGFPIRLSLHLSGPAASISAAGRYNRLQYRGQTALGAECSLVGDINLDKRIKQLQTYRQDAPDQEVYLEIRHMAVEKILQQQQQSTTKQQPRRLFLDEHR